jgi:hypothetical protein
VSGEAVIYENPRNSSNSSKTKQRQHDCRVPRKGTLGAALNAPAQNPSETRVKRERQSPTPSNCGLKVLPQNPPQDRLKRICGTTSKDLPEESVVNARVSL